MLFSAQVRGRRRVLVICETGAMQNRVDHRLLMPSKASRRLASAGTIPLPVSAGAHESLEAGDSRSP
jgi:hypothetical protein